MLIANLIFFGLDRLKVRHSKSSGLWLLVFMALFVANSSWSTIQVMRDRSKLFYCDDYPRSASRLVARTLATRLKSHDRINGIGDGYADCDDVCALYTIETLGINGYYGIRGLYKDRIETIYLISQKPSSIAKFSREVLDDRLWSIPTIVMRVGPVTAYQITRLHLDQPLPTTIAGYSD